LIHYSGTMPCMKQVGATGDDEGIGFVPLGVIFDVDDTLLDNYPATSDLGLHEQARLLALREIGEKRGIPALATIDREINRDIIKRSKEHTINGSVWQLFYELGLVDSDIIDPSDPLLHEIVARKHQLYDPVLKEFGVPLPQAVEFVKAVYILTDGHIAIASGAQYPNIITFLEMTGLVDYFLPERIICHQHIAHAKPDPEAFDLAFKSLGLPDQARSNVVAFEDDPKGITSAKAANLYAAAITSRYNQHELESCNPAPDIIRASYSEFAEALGISL